jgi:hypothetical protein
MSLRLLHNEIFNNTLIIMLIGLTHKDLFLGTYLGCMYELVNYFRLGINKKSINCHHLK